MTLITPEHMTAETDELYLSLKEEVSGLRRQLEAQRKRAFSGEEIDATAVSKTVQQCTEAIGRCHKAEIHLNELQSKRAGIAQGGYALDLDAAKNKVRCALDNLRCVRERSDVSE